MSDHQWIGIAIIYVAASVASVLFYRFAKALLYYRLELNKILHERAIQQLNRALRKSDLGDDWVLDVEGTKELHERLMGTVTYTKDDLHLFEKLKGEENKDA